jgi:hypothetical protein
MNLARHASVLWRFRRVTIAGIILGIALAIFASYSVSPSGLTPRGSETWSAVSSILVTQPGFPEGRVTLPERQIEDGVTTEGEQAVEEGSKPSDQIVFADPARLAYQADLYSRFLISDDVLRRVPEKPARAQVLASPFASAAGGQVQPVIELTTMGTSAENAHAINLHLFAALNDFINDGAKKNEIPKAGVVEIQMLSSPEVGLVSSRKPTMSVLAFMFVMLATLAVTHLLEALRSRRETDALATIVDWDAPAPSLDLDVHRNGRAAEQTEYAGRRNR